MALKQKLLGLGVENEIFFGWVHGKEAMHDQILLGQSWGTKKFYGLAGYIMLDFSVKGKKQLLFAYFHRGGGK